MKIGKATLRMAAPWGVDPRDPPHTTTKNVNKGLATWTLMMNERDDKPYQKYGYTIDCVGSATLDRGNRSPTYM